jgi:hypothetical protein
MKDREPYLLGSVFIPIDGLMRTDADIILLFLSGNGVVYSEPSNDQWYRINPMGVGEEIIAGNLSYLERVYQPLEPASALACANQYQFCNTAFEGLDGCGPMASLRDATAGVAPFFESTYEDFAMDSARTPAEALFTYFLNRFYHSGEGLPDVVSHLGPASLQSQSSMAGSLQGYLAPNQWKLDITHLWNITLASIQASMTKTAYGPTDPDTLATWYNYTEPHLQTLCQSQVC